MTLDIPNRQLNVRLTEEEMSDRQAAWQPIPPNYTSGVLSKYAKLVSSAAEGAVTRYRFGADCARKGPFSPTLAYELP